MLPFDVIRLINEFNPDAYVYQPLEKNYSILIEIEYQNTNGKPVSFLDNRHYNNMMKEKNNLTKLINTPLSNLVKSTRKFKKSSLNAMLYIIKLVVGRNVQCSNDKLNDIINIYIKEDVVFNSKYIIYNFLVFGFLVLLTLITFLPNLGKFFIFNLTVLGTCILLRLRSFLPEDFIIFFLSICLSFFFLRSI